MKQTVSTGVLSLALLAGSALAPVSVPPAHADQHAAATASMSDTSMSDTPMSDTEVAIAVDQSLIRMQGVRASLIDVDVNDGVVTLNGTVGNLLAEERALERAATVRGVRSVVDHLDVEVPARSDSEILADVQDAFYVNPGTETFEIGIAVNDGSVELTGVVDAWVERILAEDVAQSVVGVRAVQNDVVVDPTEPRSDSEIQGEIQARFENDVWIDANDIDVNVDNGIVRLSGRVDSLAEKDRAESLAFIYDVERVDTKMLAVQWMQDDRQRGYANLSDAEVANAVRKALSVDERVDATDVDVRFDGRTATLTGKVSSIMERNAAAQDAVNTVGVWRVRNQLKVRPDGTFKDAVLTSYVYDAIARDPYLNGADIDVVVDNAIARMRGTVDNPFEREHADWVVSRVKGVIEVVNMLSVSETEIGQVDVSDWELREDINDQMFWSPYVDADEVNVTVNNGVATLTGRVDTLAEFRAATVNAEQAGAPVVVNNLDIGEQNTNG